MFFICGARPHSFGAKSETELRDSDQCFIYRYIHDQDGQGITEYGAIIAFVSLLVALTFSVANGSLMPAVSKAFKEVASQLNALSSSAANAS